MGPHLSLSDLLLIAAGGAGITLIAAAVAAMAG
jgi:hypothetical protein